ncbi:MAG: hypothetical protein COX06_00540 [Candidatus Zambryskibacteria bacterium CG22_combo_CG10-13_8_21_14_all_42_17]|uniref:DNA polymerase III subunit delta n=1 Tax=Candidatus Zambryskibacteria bacterium CG22_combo_CG10-13_8_21_14_all_42_17 TaxID=1975118 RepID=A0A2H0BE50_9BACT|nr:MAG: hypothetical protein COX06_00540 [Candidatus Zambryskibacteria bacterium CG22_combo_CG10-13_8_21_14_all_42_17]
MSRNPHHANLLIGTLEEGESFMRSFSESLGVRLENNPDFFAFKSELFGIDQARELKLLSTRKSFGSVDSAKHGKKIFLITPTRLTLEAQNALLKTFEDPLPDTFFFLSVRAEGMVIPTLISRMQIIRLGGDNFSESTEARKFLSLSIKERLIFTKEFADKEKNLPVFLDNLLFFLRKQDGKIISLERVYNVRRIVDDSFVAPRLVLEHLSLVL